MDLFRQLRVLGIKLLIEILGNISTKCLKYIENLGLIHVHNLAFINDEDKWFLDRAIRVPYLLNILWNLSCRER